jgi:predicted amidohydrolase YtcJ
MEKALMELPEHERSGRRLRIEHAQIMKLEDLERAAKLGSKSSEEEICAKSDLD